MTLAEEAQLLFDEGFKSLRRGRDQAAADYFKQAHKLLVAECEGLACELVDEGRRLDEALRQIEALQTRLTTLTDQARIRDMAHNQRVTWDAW